MNDRIGPARCLANHIYVLPGPSQGHTFKQSQWTNATQGVAKEVTMQALLIFVVLLFSAALIIYTLPLLLYIAPVMIIGLVISLIDDAMHHPKATAAGH